MILKNIIRAAALSVALCSPVSAGPLDMDQDSLAEIRAKIDKDMAAAEQAFRPNQADPYDLADKYNPKSLDNIESMAKLNGNLAAYAERYQRQLEQAAVNSSQKPERKREDGLYVFISKGVSPLVLEPLTKQVRDAEGRFVLRGFTDGKPSFEETASWLYDVNKATGVETLIDPFLFRALGVDRAPAFAIVKFKDNVAECDGTDQDAGVCEESVDAAIVFGDMSVEIALKRIRKMTTQPEIAAMAGEYLKRYLSSGG